MKMKNFAPSSPFKFLFLLVITVTLFVGVKADAMPEGQKQLARYYSGWDAMLRKESDFFKFTRDFMSDYEGYSEKYSIEIIEAVQDVSIK